MFITPQIYLVVFWLNLMKMKTKQHTDHDNLPRVIDNVRAKCNEGLTDVVAGPMTLNELTREITFQCFHRSPEYMIILIEKRQDLQKYHSTLYITPKDFENYKPSGYSTKRIGGKK
jgi:hypothetical protein